MGGGHFLVTIRGPSNLLKDYEFRSVEADLIVLSSDGSVLANTREGVEVFQPGAWPDIHITPGPSPEMLGRDRNRTSARASRTSKLKPPAGLARRAKA